MKLTFEKHTLFDGYDIADENDFFRGVINMIDGGWCLDTDGEDLSLRELRQVVRFMETL